MDKFKSKRKGNQLTNTRSPKKLKMKVRNDNFEVRSRTRQLFALIPNFDSDGSSSSNDEEEMNQSTHTNENNHSTFVFHEIENDIQATLDDVMMEVPQVDIAVGDYGTFTEQQNDESVMFSPTVPFTVSHPTTESLPTQVDMAIEDYHTSTEQQNDLSVMISPTVPFTVSRPSTESPPIDNVHSYTVETSSTSYELQNTNLVADLPIIFDFDLPVHVAAEPCEIDKNNSSQNVRSSEKRILLPKKKKFKRITPKKKNVENNPRKSKNNRPPTTFEWERNEPFIGVVTETLANKCELAGKELLGPMEYFSKMFTSDIWNLLVNETNLYSCQKTGKSINVSLSEMKGFLGILLLQGVIDMPSYTDYWSNDLRYDKIANTMPLKRFQCIRRHLHFVNNAAANDESDRYIKIRPLLDLVRQNFLSIEEEGQYSVDEMMVPYKGKRAGSRRQYIKNKPKKWGIKVFIRAGVSGIIYDFLMYGGEDTFRGHTFSNVEELMGVGAKVVISLCKSIVTPACSFVFFDNFFCSLELLILLREKYGIFSLGTIRVDRLRNCPLIADKILTRRGRGSYDMAVDNAHKVCVVKWEDNKSVCLASTYCEAEPVGTIKRFPKKAKKSTGGSRSKEDVSCPNIVKEYNSFMGGVDLADMLIALYRTEFRTHRWYMAIFSQVIDMCVSNAWLLYRRDHKVFGAGKPIALKKFRLHIAEVLIKTGKRYAPRPSCSTKHVETKKLRHATEEEIRYDKTSHFPQMSGKGRCAHCKDGQTKVMCIKCNLRLCLTQERNCFFQYHSKP